MKISSTFHVSVLFMTVLMFSMPFVTLAQQNSVESEARADAEADAEADTDQRFWFVVGCFGNFWGLIYAHYAEPSPPASRLLGKSPEYVAIYSDTYTIKAKNLQTSQATSGCIANTVIVGAGCCLYYLVVLAAISAGEL